MEFQMMNKEKRISVKEKDLIRIIQKLQLGSNDKYLCNLCENRHSQEIHHHHYYIVDLL
jgi:hypothetical protein